MRALLLWVKILFLVFLSIQSIVLADEENNAWIGRKFHVSSLTQRRVTTTQFLFERQCMLRSDRFHVAADKLFFDTKIKKIEAWAGDTQPIVVQNGRIIICADYCDLDLESGVMFLKNATIRAPEGFSSAKYLFCDAAGELEGDSVSFTACDAEVPHWNIQAAYMHYADNALDLNKAQFAIAHCPVAYAPYLSVPVNQKPQSGFFVPKFSWDVNTGMGFSQKYYWFLHNHADTTLGFDWKNARGIFFSNETRFAKNQNHRLAVKGHGGYEYNVYAQRHDKIDKMGRPQYWIQGVYNDSLGRLGNLDKTSMLLNLDFGSDKKTGYEFFDRLDGVDDTFYNNAVFRGYSESGVISFRVDGNFTRRQRFFEHQLSSNKLPFNPSLFVIKPEVVSTIERQDFLNTLWKLPKVSWFSGASRAGPLYYDYELDAEYVSDRLSKAERFFLDSKIAWEDSSLFPSGGDVVRAAYAASISNQIKTPIGHVLLSCSPSLFLRSAVDAIAVQPSRYVLEQQLFSYGAYRAQVGFDATYVPFALEIKSNLSEYIAWVQPKFYFTMSPFVDSRGWRFFDGSDRIYPIQESGMRIDSLWEIDSKETIGAYISQAYDFYPSSLWFAPRRSLGRNRVLPLQFGLDYRRDNISYFFSQDICVEQARFLQSFVGLSAHFDSIQCSLGYLFQDPLAARLRGLVGLTPHSFFLNVDIPFSKKLHISYDSFAVVDTPQRPLFAFDVRPVKHGLRLIYRDHCWGVSIGYEEKIYKQCGQSRKDRMFIFSLYVDSLGKFANKIRGNSE